MESAYSILLIAVLGIGLTFFLSVKGLDDSREIASGGESKSAEKMMQTLHRRIYTRQTVSRATVKIMKVFRVLA